LRTDRLRKRFEFGRVRDQGRRVYTKSFVILLCPNSEGAQRLGLTVSQKVGGAVRRNRVKRLLREVFRLERGLFPSSTDVVIIAKAGCEVDSFEAVRGEIGQAGSALRAAASRPRAASSGPRASTNPRRGPGARASTPAGKLP
jgi:ribonuclease P protein component